MKIIASVVKGIEEISAEEIRQLEGVSNISCRQKHVEFDFLGDTTQLAHLKTVDDLSILILSANITTIINLLTKENFSEAIEWIKGIRKIKAFFSITASVYKNKDYSQDSIKSQFSDKLTKILGFSYSPLDHSNFDVKVALEGENATVLLKIFPKSLYQREYEHMSQFGSIRPTIAAAMITFLKSKVDAKTLVDNLCGSGTFLCEGFNQGLKVSGGDILSSRVEITKKNLAKVGYQDFKLYLEDASHTKFTRQFDIAVSNLPWGKQIRIDDINSLYNGIINEYRRILEINGGIGLISSNPEIVSKYLSRNFPNYKIEEYKIGYLGQTPTITFAYID
ncbi:MAG: methyltransferase [Candidatus Dojkabacteria bacterium]